VLEPFNQDEEERVMEGDGESIRECEGLEARVGKEERGPSAEESKSHMVNHIEFRPWCPQ
jgi:hypothetical protein